MSLMTNLKQAFVHAVQHDIPELAKGVDDAAEGVIAFPTVVAQYVTGTTNRFGELTSWSNFGQHFQFTWQDNTLLRIANVFNTTVYGGADLLSGHLLYRGSVALGVQKYTPFLSPCPTDARGIARDFATGALLFAMPAVKAKGYALFEIPEKAIPVSEGSVYKELVDSAERAGFAVAQARHQAKLKAQWAAAEQSPRAFNAWMQGERGVLGGQRGALSLTDSPNLTQNPVTVRGVLDAVKRGQPLSKAHIDFFVQGVVDGSIPDYQAAAFLMAVRINGMTSFETTLLTQAMTDSGKRLDLSRVDGVTVDKHSTGGISDGTSFVVAPLVATFDLKVPMMSGRGLGHTGGTLDKLEAIPGFRVSLSEDEVVHQLNQTGLAIFGQTADIAPADGRFYALRDVTETVDSIPLIAASIMSKKLAEGANGLVMNVTTGSGAFMRDFADAQKLAETMVAIAQQSGRQASSVISSMDEPLAPYVGNALEIQQAVRILRGETDRFGNFMDVSIELSAHLLVHGGLFTMEEIGRAREVLRVRLASGAALDKFRAMVVAQGGDVGAIDDLSRLPQASRVIGVVSPHDGYVSQIDATKVGLASVYLGAGREKAGAPVDPAVGIEVLKFVGDPVSNGEPLARLHVNDDQKLGAAQRTLLSAYTIGQDKVAQGNTLLEIVR